MDTADPSPMVKDEVEGFNRVLEGKQANSGKKRSWENDRKKSELKQFLIKAIIDFGENFQKLF